MYLHVGQSILVPFADVLGLFDLDNTTASRTTLAFLRKAEQEGRVENASGDIPKSFVVCGRGGEVKIYLSQLSTATLLKRAESGSFE